MISHKKSGIVFDIQSFSLHDGPGIRTLVFLKGCPLDCLWCANPEGKSSYTQIRYHSLNCTGCLECSKACPSNAITLIENLNLISIDKNKCSNCSDFKCVHACCNDCLKLSGKSMTVEEILKIVKRDFPYYRGKGGITLSGGDPIYQHEFSIEILKACKEEYINTAIESSMFANTEIMERFIPFTDLFLSDIKHMNPINHKKLTGVDNSLILKNISIISKQKPIVIRIPIIPNLNDDEENIISTAIFCKENAISRINILPYHKLGEVKYSQLGLEYKMPNTTVPDNNKMNHVKQLIESIGVNCIIG